MTIADLTERFIQAAISLDDVLQIVQERKITYAPDATMQAMLSGKKEYGLPEFLSFIQRRNTPFIMCRTMIFHRSQHTRFHNFEKLISLIENTKRRPHRWSGLLLL